MRSKALAVTAVAATLTFGLTACGGGSGDKASGSSSPLKIGVMASLTGESSATFKVTPSAVDARIKQYVGDGGKCASRFKNYDLIKADDTNTPAGALQAAQRLVQQDKVDVILQATASFYGAATYLTTNAAATKIPVLGGGFDGSPVYQKTDNNVVGLFQPNDYSKTYDTFAKLMPPVGAKSAAVIAYDNPSSEATGKQVIRSVKAAGLKVAYTNLKIPYGSTDVGAVVQGIIDSKADALITTLNPETSFAVTGGLLQAGDKMKLIRQPIGYSAQLLQSKPAVQAAQGVTFSTSTAPNEIGTAATKARAAALTTIGNTTGIASFAEDQGYLSASMLIDGLEKAGCNASMSDVLKKLRATTDWDGDGLLAQPRNFSSPSAADTSCYYYLKLTGNKFVPVSNKPICGNLVK